ncbi:hypothetical protein BAXH7_03243 [Bacillus amyloliquefaciens XH7]|nr:hypothetical protein BAXH7_03243 [Bacillus amyloliquefaciens XH7]QBG57629.1 hypothetical protein D2M30_3328 [Bacillus amyloliquefaciens]
MIFLFFLISSNDLIFLFYFRSKMPFSLKSKMVRSRYEAMKK